MAWRAHRDEHQLIVVHPDGVAGSVFVGDRIREDLVDLPIGVPAGRLRRDTVDQVVKERPGHAIGEPVVVAFDVVLGEANRHQASRAELPPTALKLSRGEPAIPTIYEGT